MKGVIPDGKDHMDSSFAVLPSRLLTDAIEQFIYHGRANPKKTWSIEAQIKKARKKIYFVNKN